MRKMSKNRMDDDVVSSTNGSLLNDDQPEPDRSNDDLEEVEAQSDDGKDDDESLDTSSKKKGPSKAKRGRKKKADSEEEYDAESGANGDFDADDDGPLESSSSKKGVSKSKRGRSKKKAGKEEKAESEEEYEVDKIIDSKKIKGKLHYLIRWKGYSADSDTWEPENTLSCPDLISKHHEEKDSKSKKESTKKTGRSKKRKSSQKDTKPAKKPKSEWDSEKADENAEYEVERILEVHHKKKTGKRDFLIHWKGWSSKFDSWEPEEHLNCPDLIEKFMAKVESARLTDTRNLRVAPESTNRFTLQTKDGGRRLSKRRGQRQRVRYDNAE